MENITTNIMELYLDDSGAIKSVVKDFDLVQGSVGAYGINVNVPRRMLNAPVTASDADILAANTVTVYSSGIDVAGEIVTTDAEQLMFVRKKIVDNTEYWTFTRATGIPADFLRNQGELKIIASVFRSYKDGVGVVHLEGRGKSQTFNTTVLESPDGDLDPDYEQTELQALYALLNNTILNMQAVYGANGAAGTVAANPPINLSTLELLKANRADTMLKYDVRMPLTVSDIDYRTDDYKTLGVMFYHAIFTVPTAATSGEMASREGMVIATNYRDHETDENLIYQDEMFIYADGMVQRTLTLDKTNNYTHIYGGIGAWATIEKSWLDFAIERIADKMDKVQNTTADNLVSFDGNGNVKDSGVAKSKIDEIVQDIDQLQTEVSGQTHRYLFSFQTTFGTDTPTPEQLTEYVEATYQIVVGAGVAAKNQDDNHLWVFYSSTGWNDDGVDTVTIATQESVGLVKGAADEYSVSVGIDGTQTVNLNADKKAAIESGVTADKVATYDGYAQQIADEITARETAVDTLTADLETTNTNLAETNGNLAELNETVTTGFENVGAEIADTQTDLTDTKNSLFGYDDADETHHDGQLETMQGAIDANAASISLLQEDKANVIVDGETVLDLADVRTELQGNIDVANENTTTQVTDLETELRGDLVAKAPNTHPLFTSETYEVTSTGALNKTITTADIRDGSTTKQPTVAMIPVTQNAARLILPEEQSAISSYGQRLSALEANPLSYNVSMSDIPNNGDASQAAVQTYLTGKYQTVSGETEIIDNTILRDETQGLAYRYYQSSGLWVALTGITVQKATNNLYAADGTLTTEGMSGVVMGDDREGKIFVEADNTMSLVGYDILKTNITNNATAITAENQRATLAEGNLSTAVGNAQTTANKGVTDAATAQGAANTAQSTANAKYTKPAVGIPKTDLVSTVQTSLNKADTALQSVADATTATKGIATLGVSGGAARYGQKADVGLNNVDNTSDANKPISTATQTALNGKQATLSLTQLANIATVPNKANNGGWTANQNLITDASGVITTENKKSLYRHFISFSKGAYDFSFEFITPQPLQLQLASFIPYLRDYGYHGSSNSPRKGLPVTIYNSGFTTGYMYYESDTYVAIYNGGGSIDASTPISDDVLKIL